MDTRQLLHGCSLFRAAFACAGLCGWFPAPAVADGARMGQNAQPGDIVVIRNVATRPADRAPTAPGTALLVNASPASLPSHAPGSDEVSDAEIAALDAGPAAGGISATNSLPRALHSALGTNDVGGNGRGDNSASTALNAPAVGGPIADGTRHIGSEVTSALSQMPLPGANH